VLNRELTTVAQRRIDELGTDIGVVATDATNDRIVDWLVDYVPQETRLIDATTAERIKKVIDAYRQTPGMTAEDVAAMLNPSVDPARALMIARTEIVRAQTQATNIYQGYLKERGLNYVRIWVTERDDLACPICGPLDGKPESEWDGIEPPAHPNCRCAIAMRLVREDQPQQPQEFDFANATAQEQAEYVRSQIPTELRQQNAQLQQAHRDLNDLLRERDKYTQGTPEYVDITNRLISINSEYQRLHRVIAPQEDALYRQTLTALRHENPQEIRLTNLHSKLSTADVSRIEEFVRLGVGVAKSDGSTWDITIKPWKGSGMAADGKSIYVNQQYVYSGGSIVHESMHILQHRSMYGRQSTDEFVATRTQGESLQSLAKLEPVYAHGLKRTDKAFKDAVEDAYTLRKYENSTMYPFKEVLSNGITSISGTATTSDTGLFEWWLQTVKDGGK
jgi:hypothetical protein